MSKMNDRKLTPFNELLRQVEEDFHLHFGGPKQTEEPKQMKKIEWEQVWPSGLKTTVRFLIDPTGTDTEEGSVAGVLGLREDGSTYPLPKDAIADAIKTLNDHTPWSEFWKDA